MTEYQMIELKKTEQRKWNKKLYEWYKLNNDYLKNFKNADEYIVYCEEQEKRYKQQTRIKFHTPSKQWSVVKGFPENEALVLALMLEVQTDHLYDAHKTLESAAKEALAAATADTWKLHDASEFILCKIQRFPVWDTHDLSIEEFPQAGGRQK